MAVKSKSDAEQVFSGSNAYSQLIELLRSMFALPLTRTFDSLAKLFVPAMMRQYETDDRRSIQSCIIFPVKQLSVAPN